MSQEQTIEEGDTVLVVNEESMLCGFSGLVICTTGTIPADYGGPIVVYFGNPDIPNQVFGIKDPTKVVDVPTRFNYLWCPKAISYIAADLILQAKRKNPSL